jgi:hypothetical protein
MTDQDFGLAFARRSATEIVRIARNSGISLIVSRLEWHRFDEAILVGEHEGWGLWRVRPPLARAN